MNETEYSQAYAAPAPRRRWGRTLLLVIIVVLIVAGALWFLKDRGLPVPGGSQPAAAAAAGSASSTLSDAQVQDILAKVGKHILLPANETPIIATVTDAATLEAQQPFYQNVSDGDYLLIYQSQARAILYDPNKDILVNVGAIQVPPPAATSTAPASVK